MITERLLNQIEQGRSGKNHGYTTGSEKLDLYTDGNICRFAAAPDQCTDGAAQ